MENGTVVSSTRWLILVRASVRIPSKMWNNYPRARRSKTRHLQPQFCPSIIYKIIININNNK
uniref:Uncharacterized protein n=1 Tax=uncultured marine virus TaxID=186617 RepID=A0A0F7L9L6_9VIRU|nr:hypothetical protein [uncultured marine virus]